MTLLHPAHTQTQTSSMRYPSSLLPVILKSQTKARGLISFSPHQACKDLDPTQGGKDNILLVWPPPILSPLYLCPGGLHQHKLNCLTDHRNTMHTPTVPSFSLCVSVCVWWAVTCKANGLPQRGGAAMLGQLSAAVAGQTGPSPL